MVLGSTMSQRMIRVGSSMKGSIMAVEASGIRIMSDSLMPFQPAIEEPSNILPSSKGEASTWWWGTETCCSLPLVSVKRKSTNFTPLSLIILSTAAADIGKPPSREIGEQIADFRPCGRHLKPVILQYLCHEWNGNNCLIHQRSR